MRHLFPIDRWCLPLYEFQPATSGHKPIRFLGSSVVFPTGILVTCWHCVDTLPSQPNNYYAAVAEIDGRQRALRLGRLSQDRRGNDLASAAVDLFDSPLNILAQAPPNGQEVLSFGYPGTLGTLTHPTDRRALRFDQQARYLEGYVTRAFAFEPPGGRPRRSYELDMPSPGGLSGAPLFARAAPNTEYGVMGIIYGRHLAHPEPGEDLPGYVFGLAHYLDVLQGLTGDALGDSTLLEQLSSVGAVTGRSARD